MSGHAVRRLFVVMLLAVTGCRNQPAEQRANPSPREVVETHAEEENAIHLASDMVRDLRISTARVEERAGASEVSALGEVVADQARYAEVAPPTGGQIVRLLVETNAVVERGTPLAQLRSAELGRARAALLTADARRELARQTLDRKRALAAERIVAAREVQEAEAAFTAADAEARAASTALRALGITDAPPDEDASVFLVRSPIAGRVLERPAVLGRFAEPTSTLFTIADLSRIWVIAHAFERDAVNVRVGSVAHVTLAALPGQEFDGRVALIGRLVDSGSRTVPIRIEAPNASGLLRPGMSTSSRIEVMGEGRMILTVPAAALQRVGERWLAFVPKAEFEFEMRPVGRGRDLGNDVEVVSGLKAGETVVVEGAFVLKAEAEKRAGGGDEHGH
jgi:cobalt-zinc-cadmium efflux system membrane fusion protein